MLAFFYQHHGSVMGKEWTSHEFPAWLCRHLALELQKFPCHAPAQRRFGGTLQRQQPGRDKNEEFNGAFDPPKYGNHRFTSPNMWYYVIKQPMIKGFSWIYIIFYNCGFLKSWVPKSHGFQWCPSWSSMTTGWYGGTLHDLGNLHMFWSIPRSRAYIDLVPPSYVCSFTAPIAIAYRLL